MTDLSDFLKCKKVRCVKAYDDCLTVGKEYSVLDILRTEVKVKDDEGAFFYWESDHFEPVIESAENPLQNAELTSELEAVEPKFKVGDKVYFGFNKNIEEIERFCDFWDGVYAKSKSGNLCPLRTCCHATQENYALLSQLYPHIKFEAPPKPLSGDKLVKAMLAKGIKNVLCFKNGTTDKVIIDRLCYEGSLMTPDCVVIGGLTPIDWYTGEPLTEAVLDE